MRADIALVLALACSFACKKSEAPAEEDKPEPATVTCKPVVATEVADAIEVSGVIAPPPKLDAIVSSPVAGRVGRVAVEEGDRVAAGAVLAVIEDPALPAGSVEARAAVASATATKAAADQELARQERLVNSGIGARRDLDEARAKAAAAAAELDAANARSGLASQQLARRELRAPFAGVVLHLWKRAGESVDGTTATPVAEIADVAVLEVRAQVPPASLARIRDGMAATVHVNGIGDLPAHVVRVSPAVDAATLLGTVRIQIDRPPSSSHTDSAMEGESMRLAARATGAMGGAGGDVGSVTPRSSPAASAATAAPPAAADAPSARTQPAKTAARPDAPNASGANGSAKSDPAAAALTLPVGSAATARIELAKRPGLLVPAAALRRSLVGADEVIVCDKDVARVRAVTIGVRDARGVEIVKGVEAGEQVVVDHVLGLTDNQPLAQGK